MTCALVRKYVAGLVCSVGIGFDFSSSSFPVGTTRGSCCMNAGPVIHTDFCNSVTVIGRVPISAGLCFVGIRCHCDALETLHILERLELIYRLCCSFLFSIHPNTSSLSEKYCVGSRFGISISFSTCSIRIASSSAAQSSARGMETSLLIDVPLGKTFVQPHTKAT